MRRASPRCAAGSLGVLLAGWYGARVARYHAEAGRRYAFERIPPVDTPDFARLLEALTGVPLRAGNRVAVLRNGDEIFPPMLSAIRAAEHTIDFSTYVYWTGDIARAFADALAARARAGVEVNVLLDAVGAAPMPAELKERMRAGGCNVVLFRPPHWYTLNRMNNRMHRKILVVDGQIGFTGGVGIADEWTGDAQNPDHYRDTHLRIRGPGVAGLTAGFQQNWSEATGRILAAHHLPAIDPLDGGVPVHVTRSSTRHGNTDAEELFFAAIAAARQRLRLTSAYFAPRAALVDAMVAAAQRGVDVRVLVNGPHVRRWPLRDAGRRSYAALLDGGVRIFEYQRTLLHAKVLTVDGAWATVGSINFDNRSFDLNNELNASIFDTGIAGVLDRHFDDDLAAAEEIEAQRWHARPLGQRAREVLTAAIQHEL